MKIILASTSPRRRNILSSNGIEFEVQIPDAKEEFSKEYNENILKNNSYKKTSSIKVKDSQECIVIGADTTVILNSVCLVKPHNFIEAIFMLKNLSGKTHSVITSYTFIKYPQKKVITSILESKVTFRKISFFEILNYLIQKKPFDKAGSYGIQDFIEDDKNVKFKNSSFISHLEGSYLNVVGLDIDLVKKSINELK